MLPGMRTLTFSEIRTNLKSVLDRVVYRVNGKGEAQALEVAQCRYLY